MINYVVFFTHEQRERLRDQFTENQDQTFSKRYKGCKGICVDSKFENFYNELVNNGIFCH